MTTTRHGFGLRFTTQPKSENTESNGSEHLRDIMASVESASIFRGPSQELMGAMARAEARVASVNNQNGNFFEARMKAAAAKIQSEIDSGAIGAKRK